MNKITQVLYKKIYATAYSRIKRNNKDLRDHLIFSLLFSPVVLGFFFAAYRLIIEGKAGVGTLGLVVLGLMIIFSMYGVISWSLRIRGILKLTLTIKPLKNKSDYLYEHIEEILKTIYKIYIAIQKSIRLKKSFVKGDDIDIDTIVSYYVALLEDIRSELERSIAQQLELLESKRSELKEVNILELQKTRIDSQIQEFEKLQKILIKV